MMDEINKNLEKQFQKLKPSVDAPEELKEEIFKTLDTLDLIGDIADLFTIKFTGVEAEFVDLITDQDQTNERTDWRSDYNNIEE